MPSLEGSQTIKEGVSEMNHSITFGEKNTWDDWHLVSQVRPFFAPPALKTKHVDIPGASGFLDLSESLTGYPVYNNREGSFEFIILNDYGEWYDIYSEIMNYLSGGGAQRAILEDERDFFYEGKFWVSDYKPGSSASEPWSTITISYSVNPYKWALQSTADDWEWDTFSFHSGIIRSALFKRIDVDTDGWVEKVYNSNEFGTAPVYPNIIVDSTDGGGMDIHFVNGNLGIDVTKHLSDGEHMDSDFIFYGPEAVRIKFSGHGNVTIDFRIGRL